MNLPNQLTFVRLGLIPIFMICFYLPFTWSHYLAGGIFMLAALTDWLDGYLARRLAQVTPLGAFIDPVADKLIVVVALVLLVGAYATPFLTIPAVVIIAREIAVSALREWMAELGERTQVAVGMVGKCKTAIQMLALTLFLIQPVNIHSMGVWISFGLLYVAVVLTLWSMMQYLSAAARKNLLKPS